MNRKKGSGLENKNEELLDSLLKILNRNTGEAQLTNIMRSLKCVCKSNVDKFNFFNNTYISLNLLMLIS
jgi:hypothetical protein